MIEYILTLITFKHVLIRVCHDRTYSHTQHIQTSVLIRVCHDRIYTLITFKHSSAATFCFLVPFLIEPAVSTLQHSFLATNCSTTAGQWMEGKMNCQWSSCREGCTKEIYTCWQVWWFSKISLKWKFMGFVFQISVEYSIDIPANDDDPSQNMRAGKLYPNVRGCGYPPRYHNLHHTALSWYSHHVTRVDCKKFAGVFGQPGSMFPCFYSEIDHDLVITELDSKEVVWLMSSDVEWLSFSDLLHFTILHQYTMLSFYGSCILPCHGMRIHLS